MPFKKDQKNHYQNIRERERERERGEVDYANMIFVN